MPVCRALSAIGLLLVGCQLHESTRHTSVPAADHLFTLATDSGPLIGIARGDLRELLGVPYAAPPVGDLRWRPPAPVAKWIEPRDATRVGHACLQLAGGQRDRDSDEDCLTLDVWAPRDDHPLPVLVWIPGGAFVGGSAGDDLYDGARLARRAHAVVVSMNYRLGALGFMAHPALARELGRAASPAFGILDQRAALEWVQHNIARVGGDPDNVTLFGQSAGAWSTCVHLVAPKSRGLFARAIMMSGACSDALYFTPQTADAQGEALAAKVGCGGDDVLACLRHKSGEEILGALPFRRGLLLLPGVWWGPIVDGVELPRMPLTMLRAGDFAHVPLMIGSARDEGIVHTRAFESVTADELSWFVGNVFGDAAVKRVTERYQRATPKQALTDIVTDGIFACQARRVARIVSAQHVPVYLYQWTHALDDPRVHALGATHSIDLFFLFGNVSLGFGLQQDELPLAAQVMDAWGAFARSGNPETATLRWPRYAVDSDAHMTLDLPIHPGAGLLRETCDFWDQTAGDR